MLRGALTSMMWQDRNLGTRLSREALDPDAPMEQAGSFTEATRCAEQKDATLEVNLDGESDVDASPQDSVGA